MVHLCLTLLHSDLLKVYEVVGKSRSLLSLVFPCYLLHQSVDAAARTSLTHTAAAVDVM